MLKGIVFSGANPVTSVGRVGALPVRITATPARGRAQHISDNTHYGRRRAAGSVVALSTMGDTQVEVCVVGGGLGGLALSIALQELGLNYVVCESAEELRTATGTLIGVGDNGMAALESISSDIPKKLKECAQLTTHSETDVYPIDTSQPHEHTLNPLKHDLFTIRWAATQNVLADLVDPEHVRCGHKCTGYSETDDGRIAVHFRDQPDIKAQLVVGADGVRSAIRRTMFPKDPGPRFLGFMNWNAVRPVPNSSLGPHSHKVRVIRDKDADGTFTTMVYLINAGQDYQFWQVRMTCEAPEFTNGSHPGGGVPGSKQRLLDRINKLGWEEVAQEIDATDESLIYERAMWDRIPLTAWAAADDKVLLLGDSAHAMYSGPGQGARMAFEDAHQLMLALKQHWPDAAAVAQQYQEARIQRATMIQNIAAGMANIPGVAKDFTSFWKDLETPEEPTFTRFMETQRWLNSYPNHMHGLPDSKYMSVEKLRAFNQHCAAVTAKYNYQYMSSKPKLLELVADSHSTV